MSAEGVRGDCKVEDDVHASSVDFCDRFTEVIDCSEMRIDQSHVKWLSLA